MIKKEILKKVENKLTASILKAREPEPRGRGYHFEATSAKGKVFVRFNKQVFYGGMYETAEDAAVAVAELREFLHEVERKSYQLGRD